MKGCLMELIANSKEDKRVFEAEGRELREQLAQLQREVATAGRNERRAREEDSARLRR